MTESKIPAERPAHSEADDSKSPDAARPEKPKPSGAESKGQAGQSAADSQRDVKPAAPPREIGGPPGPEPTRYGDWESKGRCVDF